MNDLVEQMKRAALMLPIRVHNGQDYAEAFGQDFQAMTMTPERFEALNGLPQWIDRIEALERELAVAKVDTARLDFLDTCNAALNSHFGTKYHWRLILNHNVTRLMLGHQDVDLHDSDANGLPSCRAAIDEMLSRRPERIALNDGGGE